MKKLIFLILFFSLGHLVFAQSCPSQTTYTTNSAVLVGEITNHGGDPNLEVWFRWGQGASLSNETSHQFIYVSTLPYRFCSSISGLRPCTSYSYQAVARNSTGIQYGEIFSFTTRCQTSQLITSPSADVNQSPVAVIYYWPREISPGTSILFDAFRSYDPDGYIVAYSWKVDGVTVSSRRSFNRSFPAGSYEIELTVTDNKGASDSQKLLLHVGRNIRKTVTKTVTVTKEVPVYINKKEETVDLVLASNYNLKSCSVEEIKATLVNKTNKKQKVQLVLSGDLASFYEPYMKFKEVTYELAPNSSKDIVLKIPVPPIDAGTYDLAIKLKNNGKINTYTSLANVSSGPQYAGPSNNKPGFLLGSVIDIIGDIFSSGVLTVLLLGLTIYLWYQLKKSRSSS